MIYSLFRANVSDRIEFKSETLGLRKMPVPDAEIGLASGKLPQRVDASQACRPRAVGR
ncbi:XRE family transcriptional regulator [Nakamurella sp. YIM 132087]|uniref:XRE family transcriptional regulator n=1 Tax=Nakamurella alba TaxID=2665158 RepID=A0A7K1FKL7_9ACTN|nr:XRE family transcriptional regulator [Nakamurella alba]MTD14682.1 XRE family transcriptional regulator [Nakamurella alba]